MMLRLERTARDQTAFPPRQPSLSTWALKRDSVRSVRNGPGSAVRPGRTAEPRRTRIGWV
jgi:hypothetical protein